MTDNFSIDSILSSKNEIETGTFTNILLDTDITALLLPCMYWGAISDTCDVSCYNWVTQYYHITPAIGSITVILQIKFDDTV